MAEPDIEFLPPDVRKLVSCPAAKASDRFVPELAT